MIYLINYKKNYSLRYNRLKNHFLGVKSPLSKQLCKVSLNTIFMYKNKLFNTVKTVTLGGFHLKLIFGNRKLKILVFASFSPRRYNLSIVKGSFCRYASGLVALQSTCRCRRFTVGFTAGNVG